ncbi:hypothetical protein [Halorarius litoreus]|uniref:hypothetical protein n=1 Tax=Halorarius litoreus TaxID=2962676 RepID=UPI0020CBD2F3|nr:hypothetical protein [Halorarius litoreus]
MTGIEDVTREMIRRADKRAGGNNGTFGEILVAELFGVRHTPDEANWYDLRHPDRGTKYEVKTAQTRIDGRNPDSYVDVAGRFRVWKGQTRSLIAASSAEGQTAWYVFVLLDADGGPLEIRRVKPSTVWRWATEEVGTGGWDESGHDNPDRNLQQKLPVDIVF